MLNRHALQQAMEIFTNVWNVIASLIYEYQTLLTGVIAIGAAYYAGRPVWQQLEATNLQSRIMLRDTLASRLREAQVRYQRVAKNLQGKLMDAFWLTFDPDGEAIAIHAEQAFGLEQLIRGELDWYLVKLKDTETTAVEKGKSELKTALDELLDTLQDVHWPAHNDQNDPDYAISDEDWAAILQKSSDGEMLAAEKVSAAQSAFRNLQTAQHAWLDAIRKQIAQLDHIITGNT